MTIRSNSRHAVGETGGADQRRVGRTDAIIAAGSERRSSRHGVSTSLEGSHRRSNQRGVSTSLYGSDRPSHQREVSISLGVTGSLNANYLDNHDIRPRRTANTPSAKPAARINDVSVGPTRALPQAVSGVRADTADRKITRLNSSHT